MVIINVSRPGSCPTNSNNLCYYSCVTITFHVNRLFEVEEILNKKQAYIEKKVEEEVAIIKANGTKNKRVSLAALKRKKRLEKQLEQIDGKSVFIMYLTFDSNKCLPSFTSTTGTLTTIEFQKEALENAGTNAEVMKVMGHAAKAMKAAHNNMDIDQVEDLMDEVKEQQQIAEEISNAISSPVSFGQDVDDDELLKELEDLEQEELDKVLLETGPSPTRTMETALPEVPSSPLEVAASTSKSKKKTTEEEDELAELAQWAN